MEEMQAGRKLDAIIAEKVMGLSYDRPQAEKYGAYYTDVVGQQEVKRYSTDIAAAWEVATKLKMTVSHSGEKWEAYSWEDAINHKIEYGQPTAVSNSAPHAICLAALKVVEAQNA